MRHEKDSGIHPPSLKTAELLHIFLEVPCSLNLGGEAQYSVKLVNLSDQEKAVQLTSALQAIYYNGILAAELWKRKQSLMLGPKGNSMAPRYPQTPASILTGSSLRAPPESLKRWLLAPNVPPVSLPVNTFIELHRDQSPHNSDCSQIRKQTMVAVKEVFDKVNRVQQQGSISSRLQQAAPR